MHLTITFVQRTRMLSKAKIKLIQSLIDKKHRDAHGLFTVEGHKSVMELLRSKIRVNSLFATHEWLITQEVSSFNNVGEVIEVTSDELNKISVFNTPQQVLALAEIPQQKINNQSEDLLLVLDGIQDPGNLGTIIRIADWYGISNIICSPNCADVYNPKTIQATMGSFVRVNVFRTHLPEFLRECNLPIYGALLNGKSAYELKLPNRCVLIIGSEGSGITDELIPYIQHPITIPRRGRAESLNAGIATAILCDAWARANL
jgi:TrmH family RNA methyltransferase